MQLFYPAKNHEGYREIVPIGGGATQYLGLGVLNLGPGQSCGAAAEGREAVLVILRGICDIEVDGERFTNLGKRRDVFAGPATSVYVPLGAKYTVSAAAAGAEVAVVSAKAERRFSPFVVLPSEVVINHRGVLNWQRDVHDIVVENGEGRVDRIVVGETFAYPGQWSSYPSHKHDQNDPPRETMMEEIYYFKVKPAEGFGVQVMYDADLSLRQAYLIKDGGAAAIPRGYHPVAAAPGCQVYYLWVMAGPYGRTLTPADDPKLAWLNNVAPMLK